MTCSKDSTGQSSASAAAVDGWPQSTTTNRSFCGGKARQHHSEDERTACCAAGQRNDRALHARTGAEALTGALSAALAPLLTSTDWPLPFPLLPFTPFWLPLLPLLLLLLLLLSPLLLVARKGSSFSRDLLSYIMFRHEN